MEQQLSEILDNLLGLLLLEGSYEIEETSNAFTVSIETSDAGRLIGFRGESLDGLQLLVNQIMSHKQKEGDFKRVIIDVEGWRKQKMEDLSKKAQAWAKQVLETKQDLELEPMSAWQRRIVHMIVSEAEGVESESIGEGRDRHIVIKLGTKQSLPFSDEKRKTSKAPPKARLGKVSKTKKAQDKDVKAEES